MNIKSILFVALASLLLAACGESTSPSSTSGTVDRSAQASTTGGDSAKYEKGYHYTVIDQPLDVDAGHVLEFFWYGCPHCFEVDPIIKKYAKAHDNVTLEQVHSAVPTWSMDADVFWALHGLGEETRLHDAYMSTRHNGNLTDQKEREQWLAALGADPDAMNKALVSDKTMAERKKYAAIEKRMAVGGVPAFLVSGKYAIQFKGIKSWEQMIDMVDWLIKTQP